MGQLMFHGTRRLLACLAVAAAACGDGDDESPTQATVTFVYEAPIALDPEIAEQFPGCVAAVGQTHIHPSWRQFNAFGMTPAGDRWTISFEDVPVGGRQQFRVNDANLCAADNPTGAATQDIFANGVRLTDIVGTPGIGTEPGFAFSVAADGTVAP